MDAALASYQAALTLYRAVGDRLGEANVQKAIDDVQRFRDDRDAALASYQAALTLYRAVGDRLGEANVQKAIGDVQQFRDDRDARRWPATRPPSPSTGPWAIVWAKRTCSGPSATCSSFGKKWTRRWPATEAPSPSTGPWAIVWAKQACRAIDDVQQFRDDRDAALASYQAALTLYRAVGAKLGERTCRRPSATCSSSRDDRDAALASYQARPHPLPGRGRETGRSERAEGHRRRAAVSERNGRGAGQLPGRPHPLPGRGRSSGRSEHSGGAGAAGTGQRRPTTAEALLHQAITIYRAIGDRYSVAAKLGNYGWALRRAGRYRGAALPPAGGGLFAG